ncbi:phosphoglycolate phosphatase [Candidatus Nitrosocosmicus arcticus]|uniref:Phosphoglycolate phosphatase n=1 Tax=Candidatus Nitrosocosmicus arcticus TaxID=2035267 RepID=A0A557STF5_9ARCH|nr:phosphoglycolate phosphatase [Candidatus Nitrosocosmicus arcticus]TVP39868.1 phosphoglycolate phosphatase [Candidatus Nitrosocosmicus arcticus]
MKSIKFFAIDIDGTLTLNGNGALNLDALAKLRYLVKLGYKVIYVTGRSSLEAYALSVFGGTTHIAIGENGGVITTSPVEHKLLANKENCLMGFNILTKRIKGVNQKPVFPRLTEIVLERTFDIDEGNRIFIENDLDLTLVDSNYAFHINEYKINKGFGLAFLLRKLNIDSDEAVAIGDSETDIPMFKQSRFSVTFESSAQNVRNSATHLVGGTNGEGLINAIDLIIRGKAF